MSGTVPLPDFLVREIEAHRELTVGDVEPDPAWLVFLIPERHAPAAVELSSAGLAPRAGKGGPAGQRRSTRRRLACHLARQLRSNAAREFLTKREALAHVVEHAAGELRFHDLRHSYATWLVSDGVPVNVVQKVMGHEQASTTLNRYTQTPDDFGARVLAA